MEYTTGDAVVHPRHGLGTVQGTMTRGTGKRAMTYLEVFFEEKSLTIMVPVDSLDEVGIRPPSTKVEADAILAILAEESDVSAVWAERNAETTARVKSTDITEAAMVIRDLTRHSQRIDKPLSQAERSMLEQCLQSVSLELASSLGMSQEDTKQLILERVGEPAEEPAV